jgi:hypothetical protein
MSHLTKNTLLQAATSQPTKQSLQESVFSSTQEKLKNKKIPTLQKNKTSFQRTMQTLTDTVLNVNHFRQSVCILDASLLRSKRRASTNTQRDSQKAQRQKPGSYIHTYALFVFSKFCNNKDFCSKSSILSRSNFGEGGQDSRPQSAPACSFLRFCGNLN